MYHLEKIPDEILVPNGYIEEYQGVKLRLDFDTFPLINSEEYDKIHDRKLKQIAGMIIIDYIQRNIQKFMKSELFIPYKFINELIEDIEKEKDIMHWMTTWLFNNFDKNEVKETFDKCLVDMFLPSFMVDYGYTEYEIEKINSDYLMKKSMA